MKTATTKSKIALFFIFNFSFLIFNSSFSQVPTVQDCLGAIPICQDVYVELNSYSGSGNYYNEIYNPSGPCTGDCPGSCLDGEQNSVWYIFNVQHDGFLRFTIDPAGSDDYDWAVYDLTEFDCSDIYFNYTEIQKSCNAYGQPPDGNTGISSADGGTTDCNHCGSAGSSLWNSDLYVVKGRTYVLVVENWSGTNQGFTIDFGSSTASIFDDKPPILDTVITDGIIYGDMEIAVGFSERVMCESVDPSDFLLSGPGGPFNILDVQGETCMLGGTMEKQYTLMLDRPFISNGEYFLQIVTGNDIYDGCDNVAAADTIIFNLDLIEELPEDQESLSGAISVFPNPNPGIFTILISQDVTDISIINMTGNGLYYFDKEVLTSGTLHLDLTRNGSGIYLIKAKLDDGTIVTRFVQIL